MRSAPERAEPILRALGVTIEWAGATDKRRQITIVRSSDPEALALIEKRREEQERATDEIASAVLDDDVDVDEPRRHKGYGSLHYDMVEITGSA